MAYNPPTYGETGEVYTDNVRNSLEAVRTTADEAKQKANSNDASLTATSQTADEAKEIAEAAKAFVQVPTDDRVATLVQDSTSSTGAALNAAYGRFGDPHAPLSSQVAFTKLTAPLFDTTDTGVDFPTIYWPWVMRVDDILAAPLGAYYMWFSTDHAGADGKIGLAYADSMSGPWTVHGQVYKDTVDVTTPETETPAVVYDHSAGQFVMFYHQGQVTGTQASQVTLYATSLDGIAWTRGGVALDVPDAGVYPSPAHTGYFRPFRVGDKWTAYSLLSGTNGFRFGISHSLDGYSWQLDARPLGHGIEWLPGDRSVLWNYGDVVNWRGQWLWLGLTGPFVSGGVAGSNEIAMAPLSPDFRSLTGPPQPVFGVTEAWETDAMHSVFAFTDKGRLWLVYRSGDGTVDKPYTFGAAYAEGASR